MRKTERSYLRSSGHHTGTWRTDRQTDRQTDGRTESECYTNPPRGCRPPDFRWHPPHL